MSKSDDILRRAKAGDPEALDELFSRHEKQVLGIVRKRLGTRLREDMESVDVVQSVLGDAMRGLHRFEPRGSNSEAALIAWLASIIENKLRNKSRKKVNEGPRASLDAGGLDSSEGSSGSRIEPRDELPPPVEVMERAERIGQVREAVEQLPESWREVILLRDFQQLRWKEVAQVLESTEKAVQNMHARARIRLASILDA